MACCGHVHSGCAVLACCDVFWHAVILLLTQEVRASYRGDGPKQQLDYHTVLPIIASEVAAIKTIEIIH